MKRSIFIALVLASLCFQPIGCQHTSPARTAFNITQTVITSAGAARDAWAQYYVHQRQVLANDPAGLEKLEATRAQVNAAWFHYSNAATIAILAQEAGFSNTNGVPAQVNAAINAAALPFINLIQDLIK